MVRQQSFSPRDVSRVTRIRRRSAIYIMLAIMLSQPKRVFDRRRTAGTCITRYLDDRTHGP
jgi:hypothetical protein